MAPNQEKDLEAYLNEPQMNRNEIKIGGGDTSVEQSRIIVRHNMKTRPRNGKKCWLLRLPDETMRVRDIIAAEPKIGMELNLPNPCTKRVRLCATLSVCYAVESQSGDKFSVEWRNR